MPFLPPSQQRQSTEGTVGSIVLKIYRTDHRQIFRVGRLIAVDDQSEIGFSIVQGTLPGQPVLSLFAEMGR